ncbi:carbohydrate sulfotransferase 11-like [Biomphalaria glabrata]|uniref:Carbohydrate sulfotransferase n=1 Tax=Biomphalaria glabrata TaxID=6526 RepID=A0A9W2Z018_BIOGL|nr:carbohydrate sulfotransferase 11-like [Biomphalaria glabrata]XP_055868292.1 carbohydrate sulfotransferase 11-like [Biomphalaria glabrata]XP_055868293.1 carbohydrate sulfotransferase 11-like [Biomphalaria glabrata]XP_055868294.1 carbohydrate sulfotransferase 11-like [Biomphalaria glabrata]
MSKKGIPWPPNYSKVPRLKDSPLISKKYKLTFCPAGKVASSFFTRYMMVMESNGTLTSPYDIPIAEAGRERVSSLKSLNKSGNMLSFLQSSTKVVFGRDPYSRILSAYIDKMFSPNPFYWKHWGERTLKMLRIDKTKGRCASNVTFAQFLVYALNDLRKTDVHLMPVSTLCNMCGIIYDVVGKLETVREDLDYLSRKHNISSAFQYAKDYKLSASNDVLYDSVTSAFAWKSDIKRCIGLDEMGLRIWRKLQLRGIIDSRISYPFKSGELENMTAETFISFCQEAIKASTDSAQLKKQKVRVFMEAYGSVRNVLLQKISANYGDDFDMFGYDPTPDMFENLNQFKEPRFLQWDKHWLV